MSEKYTADEERLARLFSQQLKSIQGRPGRELAPLKWDLCKRTLKAGSLVFWRYNGNQCYRGRVVRFDDKNRLIECTCDGETYFVSPLRIGQAAKSADKGKRKFRHA